MRSLVIAIWLCSVILNGEAFAQALMRPGDVFEMRLSGMPADAANEMAFLYTVADDGNVQIPLIGGVRASGLSVTQFSRAVERKFVADKVFTHPTVIISLQVNSRVVTVGGEVNTQQAIPWTADLYLSSAIKRAGGPNEFGNLGKVRLLREGKLIGIFNLKRADQDPRQNPKLLPGDEVEVSG